MKKYSSIIIVAFLVALLVIAVIVRIDVENDFMIGILGVTTFLFSALVVASLTERQRRIEYIREHDSVERAMVTYIYQTSGIWGKDFQRKTQKFLDKYLLSIFIYKIEDYYMTNISYQNLYQHILEAPTDNKKQHIAFQALLYSLNKMTTARKQTIALIEDTLPRSELFASLFLGLLIILGLMTLNTGSLLSIAVVIGLSSVVTVLISTLFSLNSADYQYEQRISEPYQKTFESIGLLRYYPMEHIKEGKATRIPEGTPYRVGIFNNPYPDTTGFEIKTVDQKSTD